MNSNPIVNNNEMDPTGKSIYQWINLEDENSYNYRINASYRQHLKLIDMDGGINLASDGSIYYNRVNTVLNKWQSNTYSASLNVSRFNAKTFDALITFGPTYTIRQSSLQKQVNNNGWGMNGLASLTVQLPKKFELSSDARYDYRGKTASFDTNFSVFIWDVQISKRFLKSENLKLILSVNDLLNQNTGFKRNINGNVISQSDYTTIKRNFMASIVWDFNKMGNKNALN